MIELWNRFEKMVYREWDWQATFCSGMITGSSFAYLVIWLTMELS